MPRHRCNKTYLLTLSGSPVSLLFCINYNECCKKNLNLCIVLVIMATLYPKQQFLPSIILQTFASYSLVLFLLFDIQKLSLANMNCCIP